MRFSFLALAGLLSSAFLMGGQAGHPVPPGLREADKLQNPADVPPLKAAKRRPADPAQLRRDAQELASLAQLIPSEFQEVESGRLPKDLGGRLRRIEKLSRHLRREISH
jgi:hypothetical protein